MSSQYDGNMIRVSLATLLEMQMQHDISEFARQRPELLRLCLPNKEPIGKVFITSTVGDENKNMLRVWEGVRKVMESPPTQMQRLFVPAFGDKVDIWGQIKLSEDTKEDTEC